MNLKLNNITKNFISLRGNIPAVKDINLEIKDKEFFVLLGPSGCGKSTILNLIAGLEKPSSGEIWFEDKMAASKEKKVFLTPKERNIAMVFQSYALYPHLNVFENIAFPLRVQKIAESSIRESVEIAAEKLKISGLFEAKPAELSGGQKQRVAIARAIVRQPEVFLLDEPLSNLDAQLRSSTRIELKQLQRNLGITTVYVTHDQVEAMTLGDRIALLRNGKIEQVGTPEELYDSPVNTFVATFIGSPPMNLIKTTVVEEKGNFFAVVSNQKITIPKDKIEYIKKQRTKDFILGIRPEYISVCKDRTNAGLRGNCLKAKINSVELMGREVLVHVLSDNNHFSFVASSKDFKIGEEINITFNPDCMHFFTGY